MSMSVTRRDGLLTDTCDDPDAAVMMPSGDMWDAKRGWHGHVGMLVMRWELWDGVTMISASAVSMHAHSEIP